jgi:hypothetical protein
MVALPKQIASVETQRFLSPKGNTEAVTPHDRYKGLYGRWQCSPFFNDTGQNCCWAHEACLFESCQ